jgi:hypothetical protein
MENEKTKIKTSFIPVQGLSLYAFPLSYYRYWR